MCFCYLDFETYSAVDLKKVSSHVYASHLSTGIHCVGLKYMWGNTSISPWIMREDELEDSGKAEGLWQVAKNPEVIFVAHNAAFEMDIWQEIMVKRYAY